MSGYCGYSKSNNAVVAEQEYKLPKSRAAKFLGIKKEAFDEIQPCEWHHTSKHYNVTHYYDLRDICTHKMINQFGNLRPSSEQLKNRDSVRAEMLENARQMLVIRREERRSDKRKKAIRKLLLKTQYAKYIKLGERAAHRPHSTTAGHLMYKLWAELGEVFHGVMGLGQDFNINHYLRSSARSLLLVAEIACYIRRNYADCSN